MSVEYTTSCPLGHACERVIEGKMDRCRWYTHVQGMNPQTGEQTDQWDCAIAWLPILTIEMSRTNRGQTQAIEFLRNQVAEGNKVMSSAIEEAKQDARLPSQ